MMVTVMGLNFWTGGRFDPGRFVGVGMGFGRCAFGVGVGGVGVVE